MNNLEELLERERQKKADAEKSELAEKTNEIDVLKNLRDADTKAFQKQIAEKNEQINALTKQSRENEELAKARNEEITDLKAQAEKLKEKFNNLKNIDYEQVILDLRNENEAIKEELWNRIRLEVNKNHRETSQLQSDLADEKKKNKRLEYADQEIQKIKRHWFLKRFLSR